MARFPVILFHAEGPRWLSAPRHATCALPFARGVWLHVEWRDRACAVHLVNRDLLRALLSTSWGWALVRPLDPGGRGRLSMLTCVQLSVDLCGIRRRLPPGRLIFCTPRRLWTILSAADWARAVRNDGARQTQGQSRKAETREGARRGPGART